MYIVGEIILSKSGNYHTTSDAELFLMRAMLEQVSINLPFIILKRMIYIAEGLPLHYHMEISLPISLGIWKLMCLWLMETTFSLPKLIMLHLSGWDTSRKEINGGIS